MKHDMTLYAESLLDICDGVFDGEVLVQQLMSLRRELVGMLHGYVRDKTLGICGNTTSYVKNCYFGSKMREWCESTKHRSYPVSVDGEQAYIEFKYCDDMFDESTEYGRLRLDLARWLLEATDDLLECVRNELRGNADEQTVSS